jgi:hypothetical protein
MDVRSSLFSRRNHLLDFNFKYDADIPFEKKAAPGFYDTSEEQAVIGGGSDASGRLLSDYEGLDVARMVQTPRTAPQCEYLWKQNTRFDIYLLIFNRRQRHDGGEKSAYKYMDFYVVMRS